MSKFTKEYHWLKPSECNFMFYTKSGSYSMYGWNARHHHFCIPYLIGFRYSISWGQ